MERADIMNDKIGNVRTMVRKRRHADDEDSRRAQAYVADRVNLKLGE